jgi:hypothetical protein
MVGDKISDYDACKNAELQKCVLKTKNTSLVKLLVKLNKKFPNK